MSETILGKLTILLRANGWKKLNGIYSKDNMTKIQYTKGKKILHIILDETQV